MAQSKRKSSWSTHVLPLGTLIYPSLTKPDVGGQYSDGNYKTKVAFEGDAIKAAHSVFTKAADIAAKAYLADNPKLKKLTIEPKLKPETDKETGEETGRYVTSLYTYGEDKDGKPRAHPPLWDAKTGKRYSGATPGGGTTARIAVRIGDYPVVAQGKFYLAVRLSEVELHEVREWTGAGESAFGYKDDDAAAGNFGGETSDASGVEDDDEIPF